MAGIFCDVSDTSAYRPYIEALWNAKITGGCSGATPCNTPGGNLNFCPTNNITNNESIVFIVKGASISQDTTLAQDKSGPDLFSDSANTSLYYGYTQQGAKYGIFCGPDREAASPDFTACLINATSNTTRAQMACWIIRALGDTDQPKQSYFDDVTSSHAYYREIGRLFERGITVGCSTAPPLFCPTNPITRQEMAVFICRAWNLDVPKSND